MLDPQKLHGVVPPVISPLTAEGRLDVPAFESVLRYLMDNGVHGLFVLGSTSEFAGLMQADRYQSMDTAVKVAAGKVPVIAGILETSTARVIEQGLRAKQAGVDGVVLAATYYHTHQPGGSHRALPDGETRGGAAHRGVRYPQHRQGQAGAAHGDPAGRGRHHRRTEGQQRRHG